MTIKEVISLRNFMIILCILMVLLLGQKAQRMSDKVNVVQEGSRLHAAGDLIGAEEKYREARENHSFSYKEEEIATQLEKLAPITAIRAGLDNVARYASSQALSGDFEGFMKSYDDLVQLKAQYMKPGGPYEAYYRKLSAASGLSEEWTTFFQHFKKQFLDTLAQNANGNDGGDDVKWKLLRIPDAFFGGSSAKQEQLNAAFRSHDTGQLKALAAAGSFGPLLESTLSMHKAYESHKYAAPWLKEQVESSGRIILKKDLEGKNISAFAEHAAAYRKFASSAGFKATQVLKYIDAQNAKLLKSAASKAKNGAYEDAIKLYTELYPLKDHSEDIAAVRLAWNIADPVRLLPGGGEQGRYNNVISGKGKYGAKVYVAATDSSGSLHYAVMNKDNAVSSFSMGVIPGFPSLHRVFFDETLEAATGEPVVVAEADSTDDNGRTLFTGYALQMQGISQLFSFSGDSYELQPDGSILVHNVGAGAGEGNAGQTAIYRKSGETYQFSEIVQAYPPIQASELELHPLQNVSISCEIYLDNSGSAVAYADGRYILLQGYQGSITGPMLLSGQFQNDYGILQTETGEESVPVFVVTSAGSLSIVN
ncbi:hypothetical protein [Paenibacillus sp. NPDC058177]|uniref:hypothetical protein n=1 Tax=Paenibacillus sp. NPDC058177 TaxID=3346369 RepID=UPI0036D9E2FF